jgi:hypothetical protein
VPEIGGEHELPGEKKEFIAQEYGPRVIESDSKPLL